MQLIFANLFVFFECAKVSDLEVSKSEELTLLNFEDRDSQDPVTFGSSICLQTSEGFFFTFKGNGEMRVE